MKRQKGGQEKMWGPGHPIGWAGVGGSDPHKRLGQKGRGEGGSVGGVQKRFGGGRGLERDDRIASTMMMVMMMTATASPRLEGADGAADGAVEKTPRIRALSQQTRMEARWLTMVAVSMIFPVAA